MVRGGRSTRGGRVVPRSWFDLFIVDTQSMVCHGEYASSICHCFT